MRLINLPEVIVGRYSPITVRQRVDGLDACFGGVTHRVSEGTGAATPVAGWKVAVP
jgi:hypothetical protein